MEDKNSSYRISRGYRLKRSTHNLIKYLQEITRTDTDSVITESCILYYKRVIKQNQKSIINNQSNNNRNEN